MTISGIAINSTDLARTIKFYGDILQARVVEQDSEHAVLDVVTGTLVVTRVPHDAPPSTWDGDDLNEGFRHIGFKVDDVDAAVVRAQTHGARMHLDPLEATGEVRIAFFYDPDGLLVEVVERHLVYDKEIDPDAVARERALPVPQRPRLDHIAVTVSDLAATVARWEPQGYVAAGTLTVPGDERGFNIHYLHGENVVVEVFTYEAPTRARVGEVGAPGFAAAILDSAPHEDARLAGEMADGNPVLADPDGLTLIVA